MDWTIKFTQKADKALRKLDKSISAKILKELEEISKLDDPRSRGKGLTGNLTGFWRYRVGNYRIVCHIQNDILIVLVVDIAHRSRIYK